MPSKITDYPATGTLEPTDVTDWSTDLAGTPTSKQITYANLLLELYADLGLDQVFLQGGNSFGETASIGTLDNEEFSFITNSTEKMKITTDGTVIINNINGAIALVVFADGFTPVSVSQTDSAGNASAISVENFSELGNIAAGSFTMRNTVEDGVSTALNLIHLLTTLDAGEIGIGIGVKYWADDDDEQTQLLGQHYYMWIDATHATRTSALVFNTVFEGVEEELLGIYGRNLIFNADAGAMDGEGVFMFGQSQDAPSGTTGGYSQIWCADFGGIDSVIHIMNGNGEIIKMVVGNSGSPYNITNGAGDLRVIDTATITLPLLARVVATHLKDAKVSGHII